MMHVKQIKNLVEAGESSRALEALDNLLALGPSNMEALKLKAYLLSQQGRFREESSIWEKLIALDAEDTEANQYFQRCFIQEREKFYFTDELPLGGRRFLAHSKSLMYTSLVGLLGCMIFLFLSRYARHQDAEIMMSNMVSMGLFFLLVVVPWIAIIVNYVRSLREIVVNGEGLFIVTRLKVHSLRWEEVSQVFVAYGNEANAGKLSLVFLAKNQERSSIEVDIAQDTASIRAPNLLIEEISNLHATPVSAPRVELGLSDRKTLKF